MQYRIYNDPFPHVIIKDTFDQRQYELIWREINFLSSKLRQPQDYNAATVENGKYLTTAKGLVLDTVYHKDYRNISDIMLLTTLIFFNPDFLEELVQKNEYWVTYRDSTLDYTKLRRYDVGDFYAPHSDSWVNALISTTICPEKVDGGSLWFPGHEMEPISAKDNQTIIFPGWVTHAVTDVRENNRYAITKFVHCGSR